MATVQHQATRPEDKISFLQKIAYGLGAFTNNLLAAAIGGMMIVLNLGLGMDPAMVGLLAAIPRLVDALIDPLMGYISDNTKSKWGRRRPYIFTGAIASGVVFALLWQLPGGQSQNYYFVHFLIGSVIFYCAYTVFAAPWVALGYELTPDYHERTRLMGVQNFIGQLAYVVSPWFLWIMTYKGFFETQVSGAAGLSVIIGIVTIGFGILPAIFLRERIKEEENIKEEKVGKKETFGEKIGLFFKGFGSTLSSKPFQKLCIAAFLVFNGFILVSSFQTYVIIYYVFGGNETEGARYAGLSGTIGAVSTFLVIIFITWIGTKIGKHKAFFVSIGISIIGYGLKWVCYNPDVPWLVLVPAPFLAFGLGGLFTIVPAMVADTVDVDELSSYERREGMFGAVFWWVIKLGMAAALAGGGFLLNATGFNVALAGAQSEQTVFLLRLFDAGIPMVTSAIAIWAIAAFPITEEKSREVREVLEQRRRKEAKISETIIPIKTPEIIMSTSEKKDRVETLLSSMTLDQKVGQMTQSERLWITPAEVKDYHIGSVLSGGGSLPGNNTTNDWVMMNDAYWEASMAQEPGRLPIPLLYGVDAIHGHNNVLGATVFPHNIGLGAANDPELIGRIAHTTAKEILATGVEWTFAPTLAVVRNDHWGRTYESYSEDPAIVRKYASEFVKGMQGDLKDESVIACAKHWVGDGGTEGIDQGETTLSFEALERIHISGYYPAIEAGVLTVMASYNSWNGEKCHGHKFLLTEVLKGRMKFEGFVISDWNGVDQLDKDFKKAIALSVNAGVDMFMVPEKWKLFIQYTKELVAEGVIGMERIDDAVRRILRVKEQYGLFERPRPSQRPLSNSSTFGSAAHREVAREAVRKSLVLLKNDNSILPLKKSAKILVAGKNADNRGHQCGGFTIQWQGLNGNDGIVGGTSVWEGIQRVAPDSVLSINGDAAETGSFDAAVVVIGERPYAEGLGDVREGGTVGTGSSMLGTGSGVIGNGQQFQPYSKTLVLADSHPEDIAVIKKIQAQGIPVIAVLISGRPLVVNEEMKLTAGFVAAWLPGSEGAGVSDVLFGEYDFNGKLTFSWPASDEDKYNLHDSVYQPLFPYGYGLNYKGV